jgi:hypothetical protein
MHSKISELLILQHPKRIQNINKNTTNLPIGGVLLWLKIEIKDKKNAPN